MTTLYGIATCDTCRKARKWLTDAGVSHRFHDLRRDGLSSEILHGWIQALGWERLLNRQSTTWRALDEADQADLDADQAQALILTHPTLMKRPLLVSGSRHLLGFKAEDYARFFAVQDKTHA